MSNRQSVIMLGLPANHPTIAAQGVNPEAIAQGVKIMTQKLREEGYDLAVVHISPEGGLDELSAKLKEQHFHCAVIGAGIRMTPDLTPFLEDVVNTLKDISPKMRIGFNTSPQSSLDAIKRSLK